MFFKGSGVDQVAAATDRAMSTVWSYLLEFVESHPSLPLDPWIDQTTIRAVREASEEVGTSYLKPIFEHLDGTISYEQIRLALARISKT
jgi:ATP-dependent DNA helicase RecQ